MWRFKTCKRTTLIALGCAAFLGGLGAVHLGWLAGWWVVPGVATALVCTLKKQWLFAVPAVLLAGLLLGMWRGSVALQEVQRYGPYFDQKVQLTGVIAQDPVYDQRGQRDFRINTVQLNGQALPGQVRVKTFDFTMRQKGETVQVTGTLRQGFGSYQAAVYFATVELVQAGNNPLDALRREFAAHVQSVLPEPHASLGLGFLLGHKSGLPDSLQQEFQALSLTHIIVASGFNLTILIRFVRRLCEKRSRYQTIACASLLMAGFVGMAGLSPSLSRAALVTSMALAAWYFGRRIHPVVLLLTAAAVTAGLNPLYLWTDIGWWLSFLAFAGVMLLAPVVQTRLFGATKPPFVVQIIIETVTAQLLATPLLLWIFGEFSVLGVVANVLVVPFIPLAMALVFVAGLVGFVSHSLAAVVALPATWLLTYITDIAHVLAAIPWAQTLLPISLPVMLGMYACLGACSYLLWQRTKHDYLSQSVIE